ncbi:MAG: dihydrolipoamide dehydrogenase [Salinarimonadaceae bacterium]|nr:MAG: dihydrolipoamide dehydrogenase [Salinarimonadaceae bacterium]
MVETCDICVIGAGSGGLSVAAGSAQMGAQVVLIEKGEMGGDCLNTGCVPSKALIAAAHAAQAGREAARFGVDFDPPKIDFARVHAHVHGVIASIAPHDSVERFEGLGVRVIKGHARFVDDSHVEVDGIRIKARRFVVATGSRAALPPVPGLKETPHLTNETVFTLTEAPTTLTVIGGGPIGIELAQAFARLGSRVTVLELFSILPRDEPEAVAILRERLVAEGIEIRENVAIESVAGSEGDVRVTLKGGESIAATHLLVAAGRSPNVEDLGLEAAGITYDAKKGVEVDARLRTSNRRVFAIGDVAGGPQFTHIAGYHSGIVIRNALFMLPAKVDYGALPWVTYADPELAHVGLTEAQARKDGHDVRTLVEPLSGNDRARAEARPDGVTKIVLDKRGRILGATILAPGAGEQIGLWGLAISRRMKIGAVAGMILPYPTLGETGKRASGSWFTPTLYGPRMRRIVGLIQRFLP